MTDIIPANPNDWTVLEKTERYKVVEGSQSCHCCFDFTVVDTNHPVMIGKEQYEGQFEPMCECFNEDEANAICAALNATEE